MADPALDEPCCGILAVDPRKFCAVLEIRESPLALIDAGLAVGHLATYCRRYIKSWVDAQRQPANPGKVALRKGDVADRQPSGSSHQASPHHEDRHCAD